MQITQSDLKRLVIYNQETGVLTYRYTEGRHKQGEVVGGDSGEYLRVSIQGKRYKLHRLIWLYETGGYPPTGLEIDHINGDKRDNRWCNLRLASHAQNACNTKKRETCTSGVKGISRLNEDRVRPRFMAQIQEKGRKFRFSRSFDLDNPLSEEQAYAEVLAWLIKTRESLHRGFSNHDLT